jgi:hypothetical protein
MAGCGSIDARLIFGLSDNMRLYKNYKLLFKYKNIIKKISY